MACFLVPATEAIITTIAAKVMQTKEKNPETVEIQLDGNYTKAERIPFSKKLKWLNKLLWGGFALLAFEHVWHGEVTPWFPFLTAASNSADTAEMLHDFFLGLSVIALGLIIWLVILLIKDPKGVVKRNLFKIK